MTLRRTALPMALLGACYLVPVPAASAPINCSKARVDVEQRICSHPALLAQDQAISDRLAFLGQQCPSQKKLLVQGQKFWLRERWDCRNGDRALAPNGTLAACLAERMDQRLRNLNAVQGCDLSPLAASYRFVDIGYMRQFSHSYVGKTVSVFGSMVLDACRKTGVPPVTGVLVGEPAAVRFPVRFSAMSDIQKEKLCVEQPLAHWEGVVEDDGRGAYLYLSDLLGGELDQ